jgi:hypothetical protein
LSISALGFSPVIVISAYGLLVWPVLIDINACAIKTVQLPGRRPQL